MVIFLGIEFAPLNTPWKRRLETVVAFHIVSLYFFLEITSACLFIYLFFTKYCFISLLYSVWLWYDRDVCERGGRRSSWFSDSSLPKHYKDYFPITLMKTADLDPQKNYVMGIHPHGIISAGAMCSLGSDATHFSKLFPGIKPYGTTLKLHFMIPFARECLIPTGACASTPKSIGYILSQPTTGNAVGIIVGGSEEVMDAHPHQAVLKLKSRKGFVRLAIMYGASLVPIFSFGENDLYSQIPNPRGSLIRKIQTKFKDLFGIPLFLVNGRGFFQYSFGIIPRRRPIYVVVGKPFDVEKDANPSEEIVNKYHAKYVDSLTQLFDEYKVKLGDDYKDQILKIV